ncbi:MAG: hypothetical protein AAF607_15885 [Pseudomonadota bacterium]
MTLINQLTENISQQWATEDTDPVKFEYLEGLSKLAHTLQIGGTA